MVALGATDFKEIEGAEGLSMTTAYASVAAVSVKERLQATSPGCYRSRSRKTLKEAAQAAFALGAAFWGRHDLPRQR